MTLSQPPKHQIKKKKKHELNLICSNYSDSVFIFVKRVKVAAAFGDV